jgi:hypothetical protein
MPGSMSGEEKRSDGLLGERSNERRRAHLAPPLLYTTALLLDSTGQVGAEETAPLWHERHNEQTLGRARLAQARIERDDGRCFRIERGREMEGIEGAQRNRQCEHQAFCATVDRGCQFRLMRRHVQLRRFAIQTLPFLAGEPLLASAATQG